MAGEMNQLTEKEQIVLSLMNLLGMDTNLTAQAMEFIGDSVLNYQLLIRYFSASELTENQTNLNEAIEKATAAKVLFE
ncbi:hypothetical protein B6J49_16125 [Klebsiella pneumoniae]|uniref:hypothetical protein n=1 Tax=Klebsiella pneumoniae TaxID=573 RepID=UPI000C7DA791|nr:hypothetical protein [Klebsiella pneumoniae]PLH82813.1 hypothetical protein B6J36_25070 [Klebsiella pneumoniae]PLI61251.1 hypothetical protein B6J49_16125 [Klebsiella pneumoniae]VGH96019.1 Uncharacterised protein [Klebsiella pneumoniae]VTN30842.1 Uncharacterised protein [Klebsiella pneumoniae]HBX8102421.1 hypothetical protein [Klebsiella pneumoniae]